MTFQNPAPGGSLSKWGEEPAVRQLLQDLIGAQIAHAYLFSGPVPERTREAALSFARSLLCAALEGGESCGTCPSCRAWARQAHPDFHLLEASGSSLKVEQIRLWRPFFNYRPQIGKRQVFLLEGPELLTAPAANSLLKALEEPLPQTVFLLLTGDYRALLPTIVSRCRLVVFRSGERTPGRSSQGFAAPEKAALISRLLREGKESELIGAVRRFGPDRAAARELLKFLVADLEQVYRARRDLFCREPGTMYSAGERERARTGIELLESLLECLVSLERGLSLLEANAQVSPVLALTLRRVQRRLRQLPPALISESNSLER
ncbi:MAG: DNA polymerase III subunit [Bacillota bacterium]|nr:DNA polymerase III subunit [Bacillota bacterium]